MIDLKNPSKPLVSKVSLHHKNFENEFNAMKIVYEVNKHILGAKDSDLIEPDNSHLLKVYKAGLIFEGDSNQQQQIQNLIQLKGSKVTIKDIQKCGSVS